MDLAKQFTINGKVFDNIGRITINGSTYILTQNGTDMVLIEVKEIDGKYNYSIPQKNENDVQQFKGLMFADEIVSNLKREIETGLISSKEQLQERIEKAAKILSKDVKLNDALHNQGIDEFQKNIKELYEYFDTIVKESPDLDFSDYTSKIVDDHEYFFDTNDNDKFLVNRSDKTLTEELKDKENDARTRGEDITEEEAYKKIVSEKEEVKTENINDIDPTKQSMDNYNVDSITGLNILKSNYQNEENIKGNLEKGIYMDDDGRVMVQDEINNDDVIVKGGEVNAQTGEEASTEIIDSNDNPISGLDPDTLSLSDIEGLLLHREELTNEQVNYLEKLRLEKEQENIINTGLTNSKQKKLVPPTSYQSYNPDNRAAYVNLIVLCLFVQLFMLFVIVGAMFFMK